MFTFGINFLLLSTVYLFGIHLTGLTHGTENTLETFVDRYKKYRKLFWCDAPLCGETVDTKELKLNQSSVDIIISVTYSKCCSNCSCDINCEKNGNCCPDRLENFPNQGNYPVGGIYGCHLTSVKSKPHMSQALKKMISKCDVNYINADVIRLCESENSKTLEEFISVSHKRTKESYRNIFCSRCNHVDDDEILIWQAKLRCRQGVFVPQSRPTILQQLKNSNSCNIVFEPPPGYSPPYCTELISRCNVTGKWTKHDSLIEAACAAYTSEFINDGVEYKNVFCFVCNTDVLFPMDCFTTTSADRWIPFISFSALLDIKLSAPPIQKQDSCLETAIFDHYKVSGERFYFVFINITGP